MLGRTWRTVAIAAIAFATSLCAFPASAQDALRVRGRIGAGVLSSPDYPGSSRQSLGPLVDVELTYGDHIFFDMDDGLGIYAFRANGLSIGISAFYRHGRASSDLPANLRVVGGISDAAQVRLVGLYELGFASLGASLVQDIGAGRGGTIELRANTAIPIGDRVVLAPEIGAVYASARHLNTWYGVTDLQAALAGVAPFQTGAGWESVYVQLGVGVKLTDSLNLVMRGELRQLVGDLGRSPIVQDRLQPSIGIGLSYTLN